MKKSLYQHTNVSAFFEKLVEQFGPYSSWENSNYPDAPGTDVHAKYIAFCTLWHIQFQNKSPSASHVLVQLAMFSGHDAGTEKYTHSDWRLHYLVKSCATDAGFISGRGVSKYKSEKSQAEINAKKLRTLFESIGDDICNFEPETENVDDLVDVKFEEILADINDIKQNLIYLKINERK